MAHFIHIKYKPKNLEDFKILIPMKNTLLNLSKELNNIILYGNEGCCKKTLLLCYLNKYFDNSNIIYNTQIIDFKLSNNYTLFYKTSQKHFEFYLTNNSHVNKLIILEILFNIVKVKSIINNHIIIVIFNIHKLNNNICFLNNIVNKYKNVILLCTSNTYIYTSNIFMQLRVSTYNYFDLLKLSLNIKKDYKLNITNDYIKNIIEDSNYNVKFLLNIYQKLINNNLIIKNNINISNKKEINEQIFIKNIIDILIKKNITDFNNIKSLLNIILIYKHNTIINIINSIFSNILYEIEDKHNFTNDVASITLNMKDNNDNDNIILLDTFILCIYKYL